VIAGESSSVPLQALRTLQYLLSNSHRGIVGSSVSLADSPADALPKRLDPLVSPQVTSLNFHQNVPSHLGLYYGSLPNASPSSAARKQQSRPSSFRLIRSYSNYRPTFGSGYNGCEPSSHLSVYRRFVTLNSWKALRLPPQGPRIVGTSP